MIAKTRYYLCAVGKPVLVLEKSFGTRQQAQTFKSSKRVHPEYQVLRGEAILNWVENNRVAIQVVLLRSIGLGEDETDHRSSNF